MGLRALNHVLPLLWSSYPSVSVVLTLTTANRGFRHACLMSQIRISQGRWSHPAGLTWQHTVLISIVEVQAAEKHTHPSICMSMLSERMEQCSVESCTQSSDHLNILDKKILHSVTPARFLCVNSVTMSVNDMVRVYLARFCIFCVFIQYFACWQNPS